MYLFELAFLFSSNIYSEVKLLDRMVILVSVLYGLSILFPIVATPNYIPTRVLGSFSSVSSLTFVFVILVIAILTDVM